MTTTELLQRHRQHRWGLDLIDRLPEPLPPVPLGVLCDREGTARDGWMPLHRELDGTVVVAVTRRPDRALIRAVEAQLPGSPFRLVAVRS